jgi:hypothetical protein
MSEGFPPTIWRTVMEDRREVLEEKLVRLLREAAEVEVELSRVEGAIVGIPHYFAHRVQGPPILTDTHITIETPNPVPHATSRCVEKRCCPLCWDFK